MDGDIFSRIEHSRTADKAVQQIERLVLEGILHAGGKAAAVVGAVPVSQEARS